jgi:two-component system, NarL family, sensor histidine kinase DevS
VCVPTDDPAVMYMTIAEGTYGRWKDVPLPADGQITGAAVAARSLVVVPDPGSDPRVPATSEPAVGLIGETIAVPMIGDGGIDGLLAVSRHPGDEPFDDLDQDLITAVAAHAGLALRLAQVRRDNEQLHLIEDRAQIAEDLRHRVIQRLFAHGLALQGTASRAPNPQMRTAIQTQIDEVDAIIRDVRAAIFSLGPPPPTVATPTDTEVVIA